MANETKKEISRTRSWFATLRTIFGRELRSYLCTPFGWVILACAMGLQGFWLQAAIQTMSKATGESVMFYMLDNVNFWFFVWGYSGIPGSVPNLGPVSSPS